MHARKAFEREEQDTSALNDQWHRASQQRLGLKINQNLEFILAHIQPFKIVSMFFDASYSLLLGIG
jgi:hypothetical protein